MDLSNQALATYTRFDLTLDYQCNRNISHVRAIYQYLRVFYSISYLSKNFLPFELFAVLSLLSFSSLLPFFFLFFLFFPRQKHIVS